MSASTAAGVAREDVGDDVVKRGPVASGSDERGESGQYPALLSIWDDAWVGLRELYTLLTRCMNPDTCAVADTATPDLVATLELRGAEEAALDEGLLKWARKLYRYGGVGAGSQLNQIHIDPVTEPNYFGRGTSPQFVSSWVVCS